MKRTDTGKRTSSPTVKIPANANDFIEQQLHQRIQSIETAFTAHAISFTGPLVFGVDDLLRIAVEQKYSQPPARRKLVLLLTTGGGYIETVQRIVDTLRTYYQLVEFIVPNYAYSAGTVLAMSGDAIHMDYYSRLGPIDPQIETQGHRMVPALGYLERYNDLIEKANSGTITTAEVQLLIKGFDQAELYQFEQAKELSVALLREWLVKYKFKNWKITRSRKLPVTHQMKKNRAEQIANRLNDTKEWHVHGHGISKDVLERKLNVIIDDFGSDPELSVKIRCYSELLSDYMERRGARGVIHFANDYRPFA